MQLKVLTEMKKKVKDKIINDSIWGPIKLHSICIKIIDTPEFQRLRYIKQLGGCSFVYPGACHTRFEHSIGTSYLSGKLVRMLRENLNTEYDIDITDRDILCVEIAGLCHDLGHGIFSHVFEKDFIPRISKRIKEYNQKEREQKHDTKEVEDDKQRKWKHEHASVQMLDRIFDNFDGDYLKKLKDNFNLDLGEGSEERQFIKSLIIGKGDGLYSGREDKKHFLYEIVANDENSIDVDKWDYFSRDCHMLGLKHNFQTMRSIMLARVIKHGEEFHVSFPKTEYMNIFDMYHARYTLHRRAYQHPVTKAVEIMVADALCLANEKLVYSGKNGTTVKLSETINDMEAYSLVTDDIIHQIRLENNNGDDKKDINKAKKIIDRIFRRDLYKCVAERKISIKEKRSQIKNEDETFIQDLLRRDEIYLKMVSFDFGSEARNPMKNVYFYKDDKPAIMRDDEIPAILPNVFQQKYLRLYWKSSLANNTMDVDGAIERFNALKEIEFNGEIVAF
ncbi:deoxynucleoside triphosphate triphosphohydrolase SAMHD1-like [Saccostrea echinata]|uniref:deoxynucleoside triphosphate triphosphohydrolase SAMHD1-like n=1 Tax=Saccostrea echinata TaxID=191078 RepID=UPI002A827B7C|nr:deoxynucleoside triphosphate triphosphohydrolase SAMHD1-like [Saccostrea echinata]